MYWHHCWKEEDKLNVMHPHKKGYHNVLIMNAEIHHELCGVNYFRKKNSANCFLVFLLMISVYIIMSFIIYYLHKV